MLDTRSARRLTFELSTTPNFKGISARLAQAREERMAEFWHKRWAESNSIEILSDQKDGAGIVSFALRYSGLYLHQNFVAAVLNDVFGVQSRGGCACAGPYAQCSPLPPPGSATH